MPAVPKPPKTSPEQRKVERQNRPKNPFKPHFGEGEAHIKAREDDHSQYKVQGSSLHSISRKKLAELEQQGKRISSTFAPSSGVKTLQRKRQVHGKTIKGLVQRTGLTPTGKLQIVGRRGRRLAPKDKQARQEIAGLQCVCGCHLPVQWAHLQRRNILSTRHDPKYSVPACDYLHNWLDQGPGVIVRPQLFDLATELGRRLTEADLTPYLVDHAYYTWLDHCRRII